MIIKVCGMRDAENIRQLDSLGIIQWMGFIFYPPSSRYVSTLPGYMPRHCRRVGVFVNETIPVIQNHIEDFGLNIIQLHGTESTSYIHSLRKSVGKHIRIIKTIPVSDDEQLKLAADYQECADYLLFETPTAQYGGSGQKFDWSILDRYDGTLPFLLTGGIGPDDVEQLQQFSHPLFAGIDLNSRFETAPAQKDIKSLLYFTTQLSLNNIKQQTI